MWGELIRDALELTGNPFISIKSPEDSRKTSLFRIGTAKPISASIKCSEREWVQRTSFSPSFVLSFYRLVSLSHVQSPPLNLLPSYERSHKHRVSRTKPDTGVGSNFGRFYNYVFPLLSQCLLFINLTFSNVLWTDINSSFHMLVGTVIIGDSRYLIFLNN